MRPAEPCSRTKASLTSSAESDEVPMVNLAVDSASSSSVGPLAAPIGHPNCQRSESERLDCPRRNGEVGRAF